LASRGTLSVPAACADFAAFAEESAWGWSKVSSDGCTSRKQRNSTHRRSSKGIAHEDKDVLGPNRKDAPAMKVLLSRSLICLLLVGLAVGSSTGCRTGTGWGWPSASSSSNWLSWNNWGWGKDSAAPKDTALASKPSTSVPKPSTTATAQPTTSVAAGTGAAAGAAQYTASNTPAYPTTNQPNNTYTAQPASAWQQNGAANQVQPTVGYQTGPYNTVSQGAAPQGAAAGPYGQTAQLSQPNYGAGTSWNPETSAPNTGAANPNYGATASPYGGNTAGGMYGTQEPSPYSADQSQQGAYGGNPAGAANYGAQPNNTAAPPWNNYSQPQPDYRSSTPPATSPYGSPAANYDAVSAAGPTPGAPAAAPASSYPGVPAALATDAGSYRPGSTAAGGVQNAAYNQPQTASGTNVSGAASYGNTYTR
jgi:hypothetical protein